MLQVSQKVAKGCSTCGKLTKYICVDCAIDDRGFIPLCENCKCAYGHKIDRLDSKMASNA